MRHRDKLPGNPANWQVRCSVCDKLFSDTERVEMLELHFRTAHPGEKNCRVKLKWIGFGPAPKSTPEFLS